MMADSRAKQSCDAKADNSPTTPRQRKKSSWKFLREEIKDKAKEIPQDSLLSIPQAARDILQEIKHDISEPRLPRARRSIHQQARHAPPPSHSLLGLHSTIARDDEIKLLQEGCEFATVVSVTEALSPEAVGYGSEIERNSSPGLIGLFQSGVDAILKGPARGCSEGLPMSEGLPVSAAVVCESGFTRLEEADMVSLPDVFRGAPPLPKRSDSPFSSSLPLPSRYRSKSFLCESDARHDMAIRSLRLRVPDYEGARNAMEGAWNLMEGELENGAVAAEQTPKVGDDDYLGVCGATPTSVVSSSRKRDRDRQKVEKDLAQKEDERMDMTKEHKVTKSLDLTLVYSRLQEWDKIDEVVGSILHIFGPPGLPPTLATPEDEMHWSQLMVRRGVACTHLGTKHFCRGEEYFNEVIKIFPKHRDAKRGLQCLRFLRKQMCTPEV